MNDSKMGNGTVAIFGASGHTGRFVFDELERRGIHAIRIGRDAAKLAASGKSSRHPARVASIDDALPFSETIMLASHPSADTIESWINVEPIRDIRDTATPEPLPADELGRSDEQFILEVVVNAAGRRRHAMRSGRDIYHVTAPIIVEAAQRLLAGEADGVSAVHALGNVVGARSLFGTLESHGVQILYSDNPPVILRREMTDVVA